MRYSIIVLCILPQPICCRCPKMLKAPKGQDGGDIIREGIHACRKGGKRNTYIWCCLLCVCLDRTQPETLNSVNGCKAMVGVFNCTTVSSVKGRMFTMSLTAGILYFMMVIYAILTSLFSLVRYYSFKVTIQLNQFMSFVCK